MISDILFDAVRDIELYIEEHSPLYNGQLNRIAICLGHMRDLQQHLYTPYVDDNETKKEVEV